MDAMATQLANACKDKEGASDADVATFMARDPPTTQAGKCMCACVMETIGVVSVGELLISIIWIQRTCNIAIQFISNIYVYGQIKDGKASHEGAIEITKKVHAGDEKALAVTNQVAADCKEVADGDRCELAFKMITCSKESLIKQGLDPKTL